MDDLILEVRRPPLSFFPQLKNKTEMIKALEQFKKKHFIKSLTTDNGSEFVAVRQWCIDNDIEQWMNEVGDHHTMGMIERFNRTLRNILDG